MEHRVEPRRPNPQLPDGGSRVPQSQVAQYKVNVSPKIRPFWEVLLPNGQPYCSIYTSTLYFAGNRFRVWAIALTTWLHGSIATFENAQQKWSNVVFCWFRDILAELQNMRASFAQRQLVIIWARLWRAHPTGLGHNVLIVPCPLQPSGLCGHQIMILQRVSFGHTCLSTVFPTVYFTQQRKDIVFCNILRIHTFFTCCSEAGSGGRADTDESRADGVREQPAAEPGRLHLEHADRRRRRHGRPPLQLRRHLPAAQKWHGEQIVLLLFKMKFESGNKKFKFAPNTMVWCTKRQSWQALWKLLSHEDKLVLVQSRFCSGYCEQVHVHSDFKIRSDIQL